MLENRFVLKRVLIFIDTDHRFFNAELIHFLNRIGDVVILNASSGDVFKHILRRHFEHLTTLFVHQQRLDEVVVVRRIVVRNRHHQIDDPNVFWHCHGESPYVNLV